LTRQQPKKPEVQNGEPVKVKQKRKKPGPRVADGVTIGMSPIVAEGGESGQSFGITTRAYRRGDKPIGRPPIYSKEDWKAIFDRVGAGASLTTALKDTGISWTHAYKMMQDHPELASDYEKAKMDRADRLAEQIVELADAEIPSHLQGVEISAWVNQKRLQVDARKWVAAKLRPKVYGDKIDVSVRDDRISVIDALEAARSRVQIGMDVTDITPKLPTDQR
jgi:hypothetical protein